MQTAVIGCIGDRYRRDRGGLVDCVRAVDLGDLEVALTRAAHDRVDRGRADTRTDRRRIVRAAKISRVSPADHARRR